MPNQQWELTILDAAPPVTDLGAFIAGDIDNDGKPEMVVGGGGKLLWYRPLDNKHGIIAEGKFHVGLALEDVDGDGKLEIVTEEHDFHSEAKRISWYKLREDGSAQWDRHFIDDNCLAGAHDLYFFDIDGDGERELIANAAYGEVWGVFIYKRTKDPFAPWKKHTVQTGFAQEGLAAGDFTGDGKIEIISGPDWYRYLGDNPFDSEWERNTFAPDFREMSRVAAHDISGNGKPDVVIMESEYKDGRLAWFENRISENPDQPWIKHELSQGLIFAHSLNVRRDKTTGATRIFVGEMNGGGWWQPINLDARLQEFISDDNGKNWTPEIIYRGAGTHQAQPFDIDNDGELEIAGKEWGLHHNLPKVHFYKKKPVSPNLQFEHRFIDRDKKLTATDLVIADVDGDGLDDIICGKWWYRQGDWKKFEIPGIYQVINAFDIDGDGRKELIATKERNPEEPITWENWYSKLSSTLYWLKPISAENNEWEEHYIGDCGGDWPHGSTFGPILEDGGMALAVTCHSANQGEADYPKIFVRPSDITQPWPMHTLAEILYGEELCSAPILGKSNNDIIAGHHIISATKGDKFCVLKLIDDLKTARICVSDITGDGKFDIVIGEEVMDFENKEIPYSRLGYLVSPDDPEKGEWEFRVIDKLRCPHSLSVADIDGDGEPEIICGEHDPFSPYRSRCRLYVYKKADPSGHTWSRFMIEDRFEHHNGAKTIKLASGRTAMVSHGWTDSIYVNLWEPRAGVIQH